MQILSAVVVQSDTPAYLKPCRLHPVLTVNKKKTTDQLPHKLVVAIDEMF